MNDIFLSVSDPVAKIVLLAFAGIGIGAILAVTRADDVTALVVLGVAALVLAPMLLK